MNCRFVRRKYNKKKIEMIATGIFRNSGTLLFPGILNLFICLLPDVDSRVRVVNQNLRL
jgi:hypothetical protein